MGGKIKQDGFPINEKKMETADHCNNHSTTFLILKVTTVRVIKYFYSKSS